MMGCGRSGLSMMMKHTLGGPCTRGHACGSTDVRAPEQRRVQQPWHLALGAYPASAFGYRLWSGPCVLTARAHWRRSPRADGAEQEVSHPANDSSERCGQRLMCRRRLFAGSGCDPHLFIGSCEPPRCFERPVTMIEEAATYPQDYVLSQLAHSLAGLNATFDAKACQAAATSSPRHAFRVFHACHHGVGVDCLRGDGTQAEEAPLKAADLQAMLVHLQQTQLAVSDARLRYALTHPGNRVRIRRVMQKLMDGEQPWVTSSMSCV